MGRVTRRKAPLLAIGLVLVCAITVVAVVRATTDRPRREHDVGRLPRPAARLPGPLVDTLGVASFNVLRHLPRRPAMRDAVRLTSDPRVDVVGWQETRAAYFPNVRERLATEGWDTWQLLGARRAVLAGGVLAAGRVARWSTAHGRGSTAEAARA